jgi:hypothetical protein
MSTKHRCSSCGYVGEIIDAYAPEVVAEIAAVVAVVIPAVVQQACCPLCREVFDDVTEYDAHRVRNCRPAPQWCPWCADLFEDPAEYDAHMAAATCKPPEVTSIPEGGNPLVTNPNPAEPAEPQE